MAEERSETHGVGNPRDPVGRACPVSFTEQRGDQPVPFVIVDDFLTPDALLALLAYVLDHEKEFIASEVVGPTHDTGVIDVAYRRSLSLFNLGQNREVFTNLIESRLPRILADLGRESFPIEHIEALVIASNDGEFFRRHNDNGIDSLKTREITFVYYFYQEPKAFGDGELRIFTSFVRALLTRTRIRFQTIAPLQNRIVFFPSCMMHEVLPVKCSSGAFVDSRFSVTGWIHKGQ